MNISGKGPFYRCKLVPFGRFQYHGRITEEIVLGKRSAVFSVLVFTQSILHQQSAVSEILERMSGFTMQSDAVSALDATYLKIANDG